MKDLKHEIQQHFETNMQQHKLFRVALTGREVWDLYLGGFDESTNPIFRDPESSTHNCNHCKNFIRRYGNIVAIDGDYKVITLFDLETVEDEYSVSLKAMSKKIGKSKITEVFFETFNELNSLPYEKVSKGQSVFRLGVEENHKQYTKEEAKLYGVVKPEEIRTFNHFYLDIPKSVVDTSGKSVEAIMGSYRDDKNVFQRAMEEITTDTYELVNDLVNQGSLLNGDTYLPRVLTMLELKKEYDDLAKKYRDNWCWVKSYQFGLAKFRNTLIGVLCTELATGEDLAKACKNWNRREDPMNKMKPTAPITAKQIEKAMKVVQDLGLEESFDRRYMNANDIDISEIKHINNDGTSKLTTKSFFDNVKPTKKSSRSKNTFDGVQEVSIDDFMSKILPTADGIEVMLENHHLGNMTTLTTSKNSESKPIFKYSNNASQTNSQNLAGKSEIRDAVVNQGGKVGVARFSIMWAEGSQDNSDLDAHCKEPDGNTIFFSRKNSIKTGGNLDIDITNPQGHKKSGKTVVENITHPTLSKMMDGEYRYLVHQYHARNSKGFKAEVEINGEIYSYEYDKPVRGMVQVATVTKKGNVLTIEHHLPEQNQSREIYGLETKQFHKVNLVCHSPNHWGDSQVGDKYYLFMIDGAKVPNPIRSFHNIDLIPELQKERKVLEVLGAKNMIPVSDDKQLSGLGFNATVRSELLVKVKGSHNRMIKVKF